jgi:hypothetical protein
MRTGELLVEACFPNLNHALPLPHGCRVPQPVPERSAPAILETPASAGTQFQPHPTPARVSSGEVAPIISKVGR